MRSEPFSDLTTVLRALGGQRVWSLIISVFGDLAQDDGSSIEGPVLSKIMATMGIKPEAVRVALHRLRNEGWITSRKSGRTSDHSLTDYGRAETVGASQRIYASPADMPTEWRIVLIEEAEIERRDQMAALGYTPLTSRAFVGTPRAMPPKDALVLHGETIPEWLRAQLTPNDLKTDYHSLHQILMHIDTNFPQETPLPPIQVAVLRCLIVHNWRRLVLKHPDLPAALYTSDWKEHDCRALVCEILRRFPKPTIAELLQ